MKVIIPPYDCGLADQIEIEDFDTWNADMTLAKIISPTLKLLLKSDGHPSVDNLDVPEYLRSEDPYSFSQDRWNWVLGEMIYAFDEIIEGNLMHKEDKRAINGLRLFGAYYCSLWT